MWPEVNLRIHVSLDPESSETVRKLTHGLTQRKTSMESKASQPEPKSTTTTSRDSGAPKSISKALVHAVWMNQAIQNRNAQDAWRSYIDRKDQVKSTGPETYDPELQSMIHAAEQEGHQKSWYQYHSPPGQYAILRP